MSCGRTVLTKFWEGVGGKLADRWTDVSIPALVFWLTGLLGALWSTGDLDSLPRLGDRLSKQSSLTQVAFILGALLIVLVSGVLVDRLSAPALRLIEGYWPKPLAAVTRRAVARVEKRARKAQQRYRIAAGSMRSGTATAEERTQYLEADRDLHRLPVEGSYLPTKVGNTLRAAEHRPAAKYGLEAITVWPCLWLVLPETARGELVTARRALDLAVSCCVWSLLFVCFTPWLPWAAAVGPGLAFICCRFWVRGQAEVFGDLFEASFDLYRVNLYEQLRWPLPARPDEEHAAGEALTAYLWRGDDGPEPVFSPPVH
jgi:hypothetical protein